jgi:hypothetical protein
MANAWAAADASLRLSAVATYADRDLALLPELRRAAQSAGARRVSIDVERTCPPENPGQDPTTPPRTCPPTRSPSPPVGFLR